MYWIVLHQIIGEMLQDIGVGKGLLKRTPKAWEIKPKMEKWDFSEIKNFLYSKENNYLKWKFLVSLESQWCQMMFCWGTQVKGYFAKTDMWKKNVLLKQTQVKGCFSIANTWKDMWWRNINKTPQTVGVVTLVCFALPWYSLLMAHIYCFALHCNVVMLERD